MLIISSKLIHMQVSFEKKLLTVLMFCELFEIEEVAGLFLKNAERLIVPIIKNFNNNILF